MNLINIPSHFAVKTTYKETSQLAGKGYNDSDYTLVIAIVQ